VTDPRAQITDALRGRVLRGLQAGILRHGQRLPTSREVAAEFGVDYRVAIAAYKALQDEGLVDLRPRGGVYVAAMSQPSADASLHASQWLVEVFSGALQREIPGLDLPELFRRSLQTLRLRAVVIAATDDQCHGLCRELRDDYGLEADGVIAREVQERTPVALLRRADVLITTAAHAEMVESLAGPLGKPFIVIAVRPELRSGEWAMLLRQPVWAVVATADFATMLARFFEGVRGSENLTILVAGRDDLSSIPADAPTYVTQRVRAEIDLSTISGRVLPAARTIATESARALFAFIVKANLRAVEGLRQE
jgi:DNA-binding transcriptional regulator YhcF (GntR family)